jgi:hypothetical protein
MDIFDNCRFSRDCAVRQTRQRHQITLASASSKVIFFMSSISY